MKKIITFLLFTLSVYGAFSQNAITYKNGKTQKVMVLTTNDNDITCQDFENKEHFTISRGFMKSHLYKISTLNCSSNHFCKFHIPVIKIKLHFTVFITSITK